MRGGLCSVGLSVGVLVVMLTDVNPRLQWTLNTLAVFLACCCDGAWLEVNELL